MLPDNSAKVKLIVVPNINGDFRKFAEIFQKFVDKSGNFDLAILTGNVFNQNKDFTQVKDLDKLNKTKFLIFDQSEVGVVAKHKLFYEHSHLSENVALLGRSGFYTFQNLRIAYLNGKEHKKYLSEDEQHYYTGCFYSRNDIDKLIENSDKSNLKTDILLINTIPTIILEEMSNNPNSPINNKSLEIDRQKLKERTSIAANLVMKKVKARYTITSVGDFYYERTPFLNPNKNISRFLNIAYFPSELKKNMKEKFVYAATLKPVNSMTESDIADLNNVESTGDIFRDVSDDLTLSFIAKTKYGDKNLKISKEEIYIGNLDRSLTYDELFDFLKQFGEISHLHMVYDKRNRFLGHAFVKFKFPSNHDEILTKSNEYSLRGRKVVIGEKVERQVTLEDIEKRCWFCFNNPNLDTDLIFKELKDFYLAYPKGPIDNFHFLILPKLHMKSFIDLNDTQKTEFVNIIKGVTKLINDNNLDYVIYEKNLPYNDNAAKHMVINIVGIEKQYSFNFLDVSTDVLNQHKLAFKEFDPKYSLTEMVNKNSYYYYLDAPTGIQFGQSVSRTKILVSLNPNQREFLDYPRIIICKLIEKEERINWKKADINKEFLVALKEKVVKYFI